jgi:hypothetical protein
MTRNIDAKSNRRLPAKLAAGIAISALLVVGAFVASAGADEHRGNYRGGYYGPGYSGCCWGGYYVAPPVVYGSPYYAAPYYAPPPVVYGPGIGIALPGVNINIP